MSQSAGVHTSTAHGSRRVLIVLPYEMSARNMIEAPVAHHLLAFSDLDITFVTRDPRDAQRLAALGPNARWRSMLRPFSGADDKVGRFRTFLGDVAFTLGFALHLPLTFRFNASRGFRGFDERLRQSWALRKPGLKEGLPLARPFGWPFAKSRTILRLFERLSLANWRRHPAVTRLFNDTTFDLVVLGHVQTPLVVPYYLEARRRGIPIVGMNGSWDQPTTKGPVLPHLDRILVQSRQVKADLIALHGTESDRIDVVGWPQMDVYARRPIAERQAILRKLGLPADRRYILLGAYSERLGRHEPDMCRKLLQQMSAGEFGDGISLIIRAHPLDADWQARLGALHAPHDCVVEAPQLGDLDHLSALLRHAELVMSSAGTISLDAAAVDTPTIALAFEDETLPYFDRPARRFDMEHYAAAIATGGIRLVKTDKDLARAIKLYVADRSHDAEGRARLRAAHLEPLDGQSSARIAQAIRQAAVAGASEGSPI